VVEELDTRYGQVDFHVGTCVVSAKPREWEVFVYWSGAAIPATLEAVACDG
jgi:hypothetical protein